MQVSSMLVDSFFIPRKQIEQQQGAKSAFCSMSATHLFLGLRLLLPLSCANTQLSACCPSASRRLLASFDLLKFKLAFISYFIMPSRTIEWCLLLCSKYILCSHGQSRGCRFYIYRLCQVTHSTTGIHLPDHNVKDLIL